MDSDMSESAASTEATKRLMSSDMSGPLSGKPDGTTTEAKVTNTCLPAGQRPNKTPIFIAGHIDTRFLPDMAAVVLSWRPNRSNEG
jgi:hypothetical protein